MGNNEELENLVELSPVWKQALVNFIQAGFAEGDVVPHEWFYAAFRLQKPDKDTRYEDASKTQLLFLAHFKKLEESLLKEHHIHLYNKFAHGYELAKVAEQTPRAEQDALEEIRKQMRKLGQRLYSVDIARLTDRERQVNADALGRLAQLAGLTKTLGAAAAVTREIAEGE